LYEVIEDRIEERSRLVRVLGFHDAGPERHGDEHETDQRCGGTAGEEIEVLPRRGRCRERFDRRHAVMLDPTGSRRKPGNQEQNESTPEHPSGTEQ
jgi:hypothetical protein